MEGEMGHMDGLINPRPGRGQFWAGFSNTGGSPKPRKRAPCQKKPLRSIWRSYRDIKTSYFTEIWCVKKIVLYFHALTEVKQRWIWFILFGFVDPWIDWTLPRSTRIWTAFYLLWMGHVRPGYKLGDLATVSDRLRIKVRWPPRKIALQRTFFDTPLYNQYIVSALHLETTFRPSVTYRMNDIFYSIQTNVAASIIRPVFAKGTS